METPRISSENTFTTSTEFNEIAKALCEAQKLYQAVNKSGYNTHLKSKYATKSDLLNATRAGLLKNDLAVVQIPSLHGQEILVVTTIFHKSGQYMRGETWMRATDAKPQGFGSVSTYAERYALRSMLGIPTEDCEELYDGEYNEKPQSKPLNTKLQAGISALVKTGRSLGCSEENLVAHVGKSLGEWDENDAKKAKEYLKGIQSA